MKTTKLSILRHTVLVALLLGLAASASAQPQRQGPQDRQARLTERLALTPAQQEIVEKAMSEEAGPGALWALSASLTPTLTDDQKARLFTPPERRAQDGQRGRAGNRSEGRRSEGRRSEGRHSEGRRSQDGPRQRPGRSSESDRDAHHEAMKAAMQSALGLTERQVDQLEALHEARQSQREERQAQRQEGVQGQRRMERPAPGQVPEEVADILTDEQEAVWAVHQALSHHGRTNRARRSPRR